MSREVPTYAFQESAPMSSASHHRRHRRGGNRWGKHSNSSAAAAAATSAPSVSDITGAPGDDPGRGGKAGASASDTGNSSAQHQLNHQHSLGSEGGGGAHGDNNDGTGSLTYSASSSVNSGSSATGESTDSSFADIMKVLDLDNNTDLAALMVKEGATVPEAHQQALILQQVAQAQQQQQQKQTSGREGSHRTVASAQGEGSKSPGASVADSLMYSTDGDSIAPQPQTVPGQPSDSYGPDGGAGVGAEGGGIVFAPAMPADRRRRNVSKSRTPRARGGVRRHSMDDEDFRSSPLSDRRHGSSSPREGGAGAATLPSLSPRPMVRSSSDAERSSCSSGGSTPTSPPPRSTPSKKRLPPPTRTGGEVWYSQWWMCGFTDALKFDPKS